ncbi:MAG: hypothetical protein ACM3VT_14040, partial [Solirubrobacterales bacterium]
MTRTRIVAIAVMMGLVVGASMAGERDDLWRQVDDAISKGLPKTAAEILGQIVPAAIEDQAWAEATKALCMKIVQEGRVQGGLPEELITRLQGEMATAPEAMKPVMEAVLAHWYWQYFQNNRWRFLQRTAAGEASGQDITTWDLARILEEIDVHFAAALEDQAGLKAIAIGEWDDLIEKGTVPDAYRPTLYDFLAHEALSFYSCGEQGALPEEVFEIMADSPIFGTVEEFLAWEPETSNTTSVKLKAVRLYQSLLSFHRDGADATAFIDADLLRLKFGYNFAVGPEKADRYIAALERFADEWKDSEISAQAIYAWASILYGRDECVEARALAQRGWTTYPSSFGGIECYNLIQSIEGRSTTMSTERVWNDPLSEIRVTYRNVTKIYFRAIPYDHIGRSTWWNLTDKQREALLAEEPALEWSAELPATEDYRQRTELLPAPQG